MTNVSHTGAIRKFLKTKGFRWVSRAQKRKYDAPARRARAVCAITYHKTKKLSTDEWEGILRAGHLRAAITKLQPSVRRWPWRILCDNERFLTAKPVNSGPQLEGLALTSRTSTGCRWW